MTMESTDVRVVAADQVKLGRGQALTEAARQRGPAYKMPRPRDSSESPHSDRAEFVETARRTATDHTSTTSPIPPSSHRQHV